MKRTALLALGLSALALLASCSPGNPNGSQSSSKIDSIPSPRPLSEEMLNSLKNASLSFSASRKTSYLEEEEAIEEGVQEVFIGKSSYSFKETSSTLEETITDVTYYKDSDGKAITYEIDFRNAVSKAIVNEGKLAFDEAFYNPFKGLALSDFTLDGEGTYSLSEDKLSSFWKPIGFYEEVITSLSLVPYTDLSVEVVIESENADDNYSAEIQGTITVSNKEDLDSPSPYASEPYTASLQAAYDELVKANSFTYRRTRKPLDESVDVDEEAYEAKISKSNPCAVVFSYDQEDASGVAKYDDGEDYSFTVEDGKAFKGDSNSIKLPFTISTVKMEIFEKVDDTHYKARTPGIAKTVAGFLMEKLGDALLVDGSAFGDSGCESLVLEMKNKKLAGFVYTVTRSLDSTGSYKEYNEVKITDVGTTSIPYEFTTGTKKEEAKFNIDPFLGNYEGYNVASSDDNAFHSFSATDIDNMTLDGEKLTFASSVKSGESFNAKWGESRYVQLSLSSTYGLSIREADDGTYKSFSKGVKSFYLYLAKKGASAPSLSDIAVSKGWSFIDYDDDEYKLVVSTALSDTKFYELSGSIYSQSEKEIAISEVSFDEDTATLSFKTSDDSFTMKFYSSEQGVAKNGSGSIKGFLSLVKD